MKGVLRQHWFLLLLLSVLVLGMFLPQVARPVAEVVPRSLVVFCVLFLMSVTLEASAMWRTLRNPGPALLAVAINIGLGPPVAWIASHLLDGQLAKGLIIALTVPCTMASAAVWTRRAAGSDAIALMVTMVTSIACFAVIPAWLGLLLGGSTEFDYTGLMWRLLTIAAAPILLAQCARAWPPVAVFADRYKPIISIFAQVGLLGIVLQGAVKASSYVAAALTGSSMLLGSLLLMILLAGIVHIVLFFTGWFLARAFRFDPPDVAAVCIAGSQKTLMIGIDVALVFGGLVILPMIAYHVLQLILDTFLAEWLRKRS